MPLIVRNDEQIQVGTTAGLVAGASSFTFDGTSGKPDYRGYEIVPSEINGRSPMVKGIDYSWNYTSGLFQLLISGDKFQNLQWYNIHFQSLPWNYPVNPASLIDYTFFIRNINIPNLSTDSSNIANMQKINSFIAKYEPECLNNILGYELYKVILNESSQRVTDLIQGAEYTDRCGKLQKWQGLVHDIDISLIANYIFFYFIEATTALTTGVNTKIPKAEAGMAVSPADKMVEAWKFFSSETKSMCFFLWMKKDSNGVRVYPEFDYSQYKKTINLSEPINTFGF